MSEISGPSSILFDEGMNAWLGKDYGKAYEELNEAGRLGSGVAYHTIASMFRNGDLGTPNERLAIRYCRHAALLGYDAAMFDLGEYYANAVHRSTPSLAEDYEFFADILSGSAEPVSLDFDDFAREWAHFWYIHAAAAGNYKAMLRLAVLYRDGIGVEQDLRRQWNGQR